MRRILVDQRMGKSVYWRSQGPDRTSPFAPRPFAVQAQQGHGAKTKASPAISAVQRSNHAGLPLGLKSGVESLSGISMAGVNVHYNSPQPAQINALAYTQGRDIHVAPGQERHLPHEAWHVVQQAQDRVKPTVQMKDEVRVNDDQGLEHEADVMGTKAAQMHGAEESENARAVTIPHDSPVQRRVGFEFETPLDLRTAEDKSPPLKTPLYKQKEWHIECDSGHLEFVTEPLNSAQEVDLVLLEIVGWAEQLKSLDPRFSEETLRRILLYERLKQEAQESNDKGGVEDAEEMLKDLRAVGETRSLAGMEANKEQIISKLFALGEVDPLTAAPQTTIGVPMDRLLSAVKLVPQMQYTLGATTQNTKEVGLAESTKTAAPVLTAAFSKTESLVKSLAIKRSGIPVTSWRKLAGILSLCASYVKTGHEHGRGRYSYAKQIAPLMSRVNFGAIYAALPEDVRPFFTADILAAAAEVNSDNLVFGQKGVSDTVPGPTVAEWVESIVANQDALSRYGVHEATQTIVKGSESMGEENSLDTEDKVHNVPLVPVELRRISKAVPLEHWQELAQEIFAFSEYLVTSENWE